MLGQSLCSNKDCEYPPPRMWYSQSLLLYRGVRAGLWPTGFVNMVVYWRILYAYAISNINLGGNSPICIFPEFG